MKKHANVAIFVPHAGCPGQCSFCNQRSISGSSVPPSPESAAKTVEDALLKLRCESAQIAFFGGSFTALDRLYMESLLQSVQKYMNRFSGIRISTRPDSIDADVLGILKKYRVTDIELGAQSMDNAVLHANLRGHTAQDTVNAAALIKSHGFGLGLQIMTGLYGDSDTTALYTANTIISLKPDYVRIYPAVILRGTQLQALYESGLYQPQSLEGAVELCANLLELFTNQRIPVIKLGLHDGADLKDGMVAGPYHPAFRELCESRIMMRKAVSQIEEKGIPQGNILLRVNASSVSKMIGQNRENILRLAAMGYHAKIIPDHQAGYLQVGIFQAE